MSESKVIFHKSLDTIPVFNYYKLIETNDFRYLISGIDVNSLPESVPELELRMAYIHFNTSHKDIDLSVQVAYFEALKKYNDYLSDFGTQQKAHDSFLKYCRVLDTHFFDYKYDNKVFNKSHELRNYLYSIMDFMEAFAQTYEIIDYNKIVAETKNKWDLYGDILFIKNILDYQIDEFKSTAKLFMHMKKKAVENYNNKMKKA